MFTGLIAEVGTISSLNKREADLEIGISCTFASELSPGESVATSGICLTVTRVAGDTFYAYAMPEPSGSPLWDKKAWGEGVNLERALLPTDRLGGHLVAGHIDGTGR